MKRIFKLFQIVLLIYGVIGAEAEEVKSVSVMEGDSVTLDPDLSQLQGIKLMLWRFGDNGSVIAQIDGNDISYPFLTEIFGGRLQLDHQTGSLTINNMRIKHSGLYKLQIYHNTGTSRMAFSVTVYESPITDVGEAEMTTLSVMAGDPVTLQTDVEVQTDELIVWRFGDKGKLIAKHDLEAKSSPIYETDETFRDRLKLDQPGSLTITHTRTTDSGLYTVKISSNNKQTIYKRFTVAVSAVPDPGLSSGAVAGIVVVVLLVFAVVAAGVIYYRRRISELEKLKVVSVSVEEGGSVTLHTDVIKIQTDDGIEWRFGDGGPLIAEIKGGISKIYEDVLDGRFRGRLKLDMKTGSLAITNMRYTDSGLYQLKIKSGSGVSYKKFIVTLSERKITVKEGESVTLNPETEIQRDDQILWMFMGDLIAQIKGGTRETFDDVPGVRFRDRLKLDEKTGSLTITNIRYEESGHYNLQIISSRGTTNKIFSVTVREREITVKEGESVTLNPETEIQRDDLILWMCGGNLIAQIKGGTRETFDDVPDVRFRGRLKLDEKTGSLTITNIRYEESGHYNLQIISSRGNTDKRFSVTVEAVTHEEREISMKEGESVTLNTETEIQRDDQILWMCGGNLIAQIKGGTRETFDDVPGGRFRGRLKLDEKTGSLTITNMTNEESGHYRLLIISSRGNTNKRFSVTVEVTALKPQSNKKNRDGGNESVTVVMPLLNDVDERQVTSSL